MRNGNSTYSLHHIGNRVTGAPAAQPAFDDDGNLTSDGNGKWFSCNGENRMIEVRDYDQTPADGAVRTLFVYDSQGRRVQKLNESYDLATDNWTATSDLRYFYDNWNLLFEIDTLSPDPTRYYVWGLDLSQSMQGAGGVGGLLFTKAGAQTHAISYDANGNISEYIDLADGSVDAHLEYDAFGRTIASTGAAPANFGFSTKYLDDESGYYYYGFRYYDPETGRWPNRDPIEEEGGYNLYAFVGNDGVNLWDRLGLEWEFDWQSNKHFLDPEVPRPGEYTSCITGKCSDRPGDDGFEGPDWNPTGWAEAFSDFALWYVGDNVPPTSHYGPGSSRSNRMSKSQIANKLRQFFKDKNKGKCCEDWEGVTDYGGKFGVAEFVRDLPNGTAHFVGSADGEVSIDNVDGANRSLTVTFTFTNKTHIRSLFYGLTPEMLNNPWGAPMGDWEQVYEWNETFNCP